MGKEIRAALRIRIVQQFYFFIVPLAWWSRPSFLLNQLFRHLGCLRPSQRAWNFRP
jgi:hypothetical protein